MRVQSTSKASTSAPDAKAILISLGLKIAAVDLGWHVLALSITALSSGFCVERIYLLIRQAITPMPTETPMASK